MYCLAKTSLAKRIRHASFNTYSYERESSKTAEGSWKSLHQIQSPHGINVKFIIVNKKLRSFRIRTKI